MNIWGSIPKYCAMFDIAQRGVTPAPGLIAHDFELTWSWEHLHWQFCLHPVGGAVGKHVHPRAGTAGGASWRSGNATERTRSNVLLVMPVCVHCSKPLMNMQLHFQCCCSLNGCSDIIVAKGVLLMKGSVNTTSQTSLVSLQQSCAKDNLASYT